MFDHKVKELIHRSQMFISSLTADERAAVYQAVHELVEASGDQQLLVIVLPESLEQLDAITDLESLTELPFDPHQKEGARVEHPMDSKLLTLALFTKGMVLKASAKGEQFLSLLSHCKQLLITALVEFNALIPEHKIERARKIAWMTQEKGRIILH